MGQLSQKQDKENDFESLKKLILSCPASDFNEFSNIMNSAPKNLPEEFAAWKLAFLYKCLIIMNEEEHDIGLNIPAIICKFNTITTKSLADINSLNAEIKLQAQSNLCYIALATGDRKYIKKIPDEIVRSILS